MRTIELINDTTRAIIAPEAGGRLLQLSFHDGGDWLSLLVEPSDTATLRREPLLWSCYPMAPWPGRIDRSSFTWNGAGYTLPQNDGPHSIHGRGVYLPWTASHASATSCVLERAIGLDCGWPFPALLRQTFSIGAHALTMSIEVHARGDAAFPAGVGWHPWFRRDVRPGADPEVLVPATGRYVSRPDLIPTGEIVEPAGDADLRGGPPLAGRRLDDFYRGVTAPMRIRWGDIALTMTSSAHCAHAVVFTGSDRGFCVEPQTCAPDAFNLAARGIDGTGLEIVTPEAPLVSETVWRFG